MTHHFAKAFKRYALGQKHCGECVTGSVECNFLFCNNTCFLNKFTYIRIASRIGWHWEYKIISCNSTIFPNDKFRDFQKADVGSNI